jgi:hypothetical protein
MYIYMYIIGHIYLQSLTVLSTLAVAHPILPPSEAPILADEKAGWNLTSVNLQSSKVSVL